MAVTITEGITKRMVAISCEEDLKLSPKFIHINPPPDDGRCDCCGKHLNELKSFSVTGHVWGMDIEDALLVKTGRPMGPPDEEVDRIMKEFFGSCFSDEDEKKAEERLIEVYGEEKAGKLMGSFEESHMVTTTWLCRECKDLDIEAYFEVKVARQSQDLCDCIP